MEGLLVNADGHNTINWPIGITLGGSNPECYNITTGNFVRAPSTFGRFFEHLGPAGGWLTLQEAAEMQS